jgi:hypothetical protein
MAYDEINQLFVDRLEAKLRRLRQAYREYQKTNSTDAVGRLSRSMMTLAKFHREYGDRLGPPRRRRRAHPDVPGLEEQHDALGSGDRGPRRGVRQVSVAGTAGEITLDGYAAVAVHYRGTKHFRLVPFVNARPQ